MKTRFISMDFRGAGKKGPSDLAPKTKRQGIGLPWGSTGDGGKSWRFGQHHPMVTKDSEQNKMKVLDKGKDSTLSYPYHFLPHGCCFKRTGELLM